MKKNTVITLRLSKDTLQILNKKAKEEGYKSRSEFIRVIIDKYTTHKRKTPTKANKEVNNND